MTKQKGILMFGTENMLSTEEELINKGIIRVEEKTQEEWEDKLYYELHEEELEEIQVD